MSSKKTTAKTAAKKAPARTPVHEWTNGDDEVLVLRFADQSGKSYGGFQHPMTVGESVTAPDWKPNLTCGGGIHGWPWGIGIGDGKSPDWVDGLWQVYGVKPNDLVGGVDNGIKVKFKTGTLRFVGGWYEAMLFILDGQKKWVEQFAEGAEHTTDDKGASVATGYRSASIATGYRSASSATGYRSASSATGYSSASSATGDSSASVATGYSSASVATGDSSASVVTGPFGRARAGKFGCIALAWWNEKENRCEMRCALVGDGDGDGQLKPDTWYKLDEAGAFVPCDGDDV